MSGEREEQKQSPSVLLGVRVCFMVAGASANRLEK